MITDLQTKTAEALACLDTMIEWTRLSVSISHLATFTNLAGAVISGINCWARDCDLAAIAVGIFQLTVAAAVYFTNRPARARLKTLRLLRRDYLRMAATKNLNALESILEQIDTHFEKLK